MRPVFGDLLDDLNAVRGLGGGSGDSYVDKDLRTRLGDKVRSRFNLRYCGGDSLARCRASLWEAIHQAADDLTADLGPDPATWLKRAARTGFIPGLLPDTFPFTNRPTFQQVLELRRHRR